MLNNYIELIISLVVIYALLSTLVSLINELYRNIFKDRGRMMYAYIRKMLDDGKNIDLTYLIFRHPLIDNSRKDESYRPAYIDDKVFATAFIQTIGDLSTDVKYEKLENGDVKPIESRLSDPLNRFKAGVLLLHHTPIKSTLLGMVERAELDKNDAYLNLENQVKEWFNYQMSSLSAHYKHKQRKSLLFFGFVVTFFLNVDSLHLVHELRKDPALRSQLVAKSEVYLKQYEEMQFELKAASSTLDDSSLQTFSKGLQSISTNIKSTKDEIDNLGLPIGYSWSSAPFVWFTASQCKGDNCMLDKCDNCECNNYAGTIDNYTCQRNSPSFTSIVMYLLGVVITAFSLSMGAPFWFEILNKAVNVRRGGR